MSLSAEPSAPLATPPSRFYALDSDVILNVCGNGLQFRDLRRKKREHMRNPNGVAGVACSAFLGSKGLLAYSPRVLSPSIYVYHKTKILTATLSGGTEFEYADLAFSRDGERFYAIGGLTDYRLYAWNLPAQQPVQWNATGPAALPAKCDWISVDPTDNKRVATGGRKGIFFWQFTEELGETSAAMTRLASVAAGGKKKKKKKKKQTERDEGEGLDVCVSVVGDVVDDLDAMTLADGITSASDLHRQFTSARWGDDGAFFAISAANDVSQIDPATGTTLATVTIKSGWGDVVDLLVRPSHVVLLCGDGTVRWIERGGEGESFSSAVPSLSKVAQSIALKDIGKPNSVALSGNKKKIDSPKPGRKSPKSAKRSPKAARKEAKLAEDAELASMGPPIKPLCFSVVPDSPACIIGDTCGRAFSVPLDVPDPDEELDPMQMPTEEELEAKAAAPFGAVLCEAIHEPVRALLTAPGGSRIVAVGSKTVRLWNCSKKTIVNELAVASGTVSGVAGTDEGAAPTEVICADSFHLTSLVAVGLSNGVVKFVRIGNSGSLTIVGAERRHTSAVLQVMFHPDQQMVATASADSLCVIDCTSAGGKLVGYYNLETAMVGKVRFMTWQQGSSLLLTFADGTVRQIDTSNAVVGGTGPEVMEAKGPIKSLGKGAPTAVIADACAPNSLLVSSFSDKRLKHCKGINWRQQSVPEVGPAATDSLSCHQMGISALAVYRSVPWGSDGGTVSGAERLAVSGCRDGSVAAWSLSSKQDKCESSDEPKSVHEGSVKLLAFSMDGSSVISYGADGVLFLWSLSGDAVRASKELAALAASTAETALAAKTWKAVATKEEDDRAMATAKTELERLAADAATKLAAEAAEVRKVRAGQCADLAKQLRSLLKKNSTVPDLERLDRPEFCIDIAGRERQLLKNEKAGETIRRQLEVDDLKVAIRSSNVRADTWDAMATNGRDCYAFVSGEFVRNFPVRKPTAEEERRTRIAIRMRTIELREQRCDKAANEKQWRGRIGEISANCGFLLNAGQLQPLPNGVPRGRVTVDALAEGSAERDESESASKSMVVDKSTGETLGDLLYNPALIRTEHQKRMQLIMLQQLVVDQKNGFNDMFEGLAAKKETEMEKIKGKNNRIEEILTELSIEDDYFVPCRMDGERPESVLEVAADEISIEKYITAEMQAKLDEEARIAAEKAANQTGMDAGTRALQDMMNGTLEKKKDLSAMEVEIVREDWMDDIAIEDMTEDQKKEVEKFERRVAEAEEEKEKYIKALGLELRKLKVESLEIAAKFDDAVEKMQARRHEVMSILIAEELYRCKLAGELVDKELIEKRLVSLAAEMDRKSEELSVSSDKRKAVSDRATELTAATAALADADKILVLNFKRSIQDASATGIDHDTLKSLSSLFKRRRGAPKSVDAIDEAALRDALQPLHPDRDVPEGFICEPEVWTLLNELRSAKIRSEWALAGAQKAEADCKELLKNLTADEERVKEEMKGLERQVNAAEKKKADDMRNATVMIQLIQGLCEVEGGGESESNGDDTVSADDAILVPRRVVERLNGFVTDRGMEKVEVMHKIKEFRKALNVTDWQAKWQKEQIHHLTEHYTDCHMLRVTKEMQDCIRHGTVVDQNAKAMEVGQMKLKHMISMLGKKKRKLSLQASKINRQLAKKAAENETLAEKCEELRAKVASRERIFKSSNKNRNSEKEQNKQKMRAIVTRRKLIDLARAQTDETEFLRQDLDKLRQRTFPSFAHSSRAANRRAPDDVF